MKNKIKNPLVKRIPKELAGDWRKYLVVSLFLILVIGFVSGMYVANNSMMTAVKKSSDKYILEDGHFELSERADIQLLINISSGKMADIKSYYTDKAKSELDDKFEAEFIKEFTQKFDSEFQSEFDKAFEEQTKQALISQGLSEAAADSMLADTIAQAKKSGNYDSAYLKAYEESYRTAYDEAYTSAYDSAWSEILDEIDSEYAEAEEKYRLNDTDLKPVPVKVYENFFRNETEDNNNDGSSDGTVRVFTKTESINLACIMDGRFPETADEIAIDRMHADNIGIEVGNSITVGGKSFNVVGLIAYVNYSTLHEKSTDFMFDAIKFNVAMVTQDGFERLESPIHYNYAWRYDAAASDEKQEKALADDFLPALLTQTVAHENELIDFLPRYLNSAVTFAADDMGSDMAMGGVLLNILIVIIAFIFAVTVSNTIVREAKAIGTLRASGYTKGELIAHYLAMPVIVTLFGAAAGNLMGYTVFKNVVVSMYYNSYSLPIYETLWSPYAFVKTTCIPVALMLAVNLIIITKELQHTPLEFLRGELKKSRRKKAVRLPRWSFLSRFRLRIILQNIPNYLILFCGVFFIMVMLAMAVGMPDTLDFYKSNASEMMFSDYQYVLKSYEDEDGNAVTTRNGEAEQFCMSALKIRQDGRSEEISVYGITDNSRYVEISGLSSLKDGEIYLSDSFRDKYGFSAGDDITLEEKYENRQYTFKVAGFYDKSLSLSAYLPVEQFRTVFGLEDGEFTGYLSNSELDDISADNIAAVITQHDIIKMCDQLDHSMGAYMQYFQVLCILLSAVMIYLLTKIIIEKNENAISLTKILGYDSKEIAGLYLISTSIILVIADAASVILGSAVMRYVWKAMMMDYTGWFAFRISAGGYAKMFLFVLIGYLIVAAVDFRRIKRVPMDEVLKNAE